MKMQATRESRIGMRLVLGCLIALVLGGCASLGGHNAANNAATATKFGVNAVNLSAQVVKVEPEVAKAHTLVEQNMGKFPPAQQKQLKQAWKSVHKAEADVNGIISGNNGAAKVLVSLSQVEAVYQNAKYGYLNARGVIDQHMGAFSPGQKARLKKLNSDAHKLAADMRKLKNVKTQSNVNVNKVLTTALTMASTGAKIAAIAGG